MLRNRYTPRTNNRTHCWHWIDAIFVHYICSLFVIQVKTFIQRSQYVFNKRCIESDAFSIITTGKHFFSCSLRFESIKRNSFVFFIRESIKQAIVRNNCSATFNEKSTGVAFVWEFEVFIYRKNVAKKKIERKCRAKITERILQPTKYCLNMISL